MATTRVWQNIFIRRAATALGPAVFFTALTLAFTWPLGNLWNPVLPDHDDSMFSVWRLAWIAHQLPIDPLRLFDANIFYPQTDTLAYSDAMLLLGIVGAPLIWMGVHPVVVHNVLLLGAFVSAGLGAAHLVRYFTPSRSAQLVAGTIFAFAPYRFAHLGHLELLWTVFLPLALLCLYKGMEQPTIRRGLALGLVVGLQGLCSVYYVVFAVMWLIPATLLATLHVRTTPSRRHLWAALAAVAFAAVLIAPYLGPYSRARQELPPRTSQELQRYSAELTDYLRAAPSNRIYPSFASPAPDERSLFVGTTALALAVVAVVFAPLRAALLLAVLGLLAVDLSLGINGISYNLLRQLLPPLGGFRAPARFGVFVLLVVAVLAGIAVARLLATTTSRRRRVATAALVAVLSIEYWSAPIATRQPPLEPPDVYAWLADAPPTVVLEVPVPTPQTLWRYETTYQYFSIYHWHQLANGYSGYAPASYVRLLNALRDFPSNRSVEYLRQRGVRVVILHERYLQPHVFTAMLAACKNPSWFDEVTSFPAPGGSKAIVCRVARSD